MTLVTYIPRLLPFLFISDRPLPAYWRRFLQFIPYSALGALIFPGVFQAIPGKPWVVLAGIGAAAGCAWFGRSMILSVFVAVGVTFILLSI